MMTDAEFAALQEECREYVRRTSFAQPASEEEREYAPHQHAEFEESRH